MIGARARLLPLSLSAVVALLGTLWLAPAAAAQPPRVITTITSAGSDGAGVTVVLGSDATERDARAARLVLPGRPPLQPAAVIPVWSRELAVAVVLPPTGTLSKEEGAAAKSAAADLVLRAPRGALMTVVDAGAAPPTASPLTADPVVALSRITEATPRGNPSGSTSAIGLGAWLLAGAPRPVRVVIVLAAPGTPAPDDFPTAARSVRCADAALHVVEVRGANAGWRALVEQSQGTAVATRTGGSVDATELLRGSYLLRFGLPPDALPVLAELSLGVSRAGETVRLQLGDAVPRAELPRAPSPGPGADYAGFWRYAVVLVFAALLVLVVAYRTRPALTGVPRAGPATPAKPLPDVPAQGHPSPDRTPGSGSPGTHVVPAELAELVEFVISQTGRPVDRWAVAATLESRGLRDVDAQTRYGEPDIFGLADRVHAECRQVLTQDEPGRPKPAAMRWHRRVRRFLQFYVRGAFYGLPIIVQTLAVVFLGYALWASPRFDNAKASTVAIATLASFVVTGGFVQALGRLGLFYLEQQSYLLARRVCLRIVRAGLVAVLVVGALAVLANEAGDWIPEGLSRTAAAYYVLLSALWLLLGVLYAMQLRVAILASFVAGIVAVGLVQGSLDVPIEVAHWVGLALANAVAATWGWLALTRRVRSAGATARLARLPRRRLLVHAASPYFVYGVLYFGFLFLDRALAWSVGERPLPLWFDTPYEIGLDFALLVLVLTLAQLEYTVHEFSASIGAVQESFPAENTRGHNQYFVRFYLRQLAVLAALVAASTLLVTGALIALEEAEYSAVDTASVVTEGVFAWGATGYALLVLSLLNGVFLFSLSRPRLVVPPLVVALLVNAAVGWHLSRTIDYWFAVVGLAAGALVFAVLTTAAAIRVLRRLDYYYYSAF